MVGSWAAWRTVVPPKTILILGGGVGGLTAANVLRQQLPPEDRVVLVDRTGQHLFAPSLLWLMVGMRQPTDLTRDLHTMVRPGIEIVRADVRELDPERQRVIADSHEL